MNNEIRKIGKFLCYVLIVFVFACNQMSELYLDEAAGENGGFEVVKNGLPANWLMYTPNTVPEGDFKIMIDTLDPKEGNQSLKFLVKSCSSMGGWHSPGFSTERKVEKNSNYIFSCWIKNEEAEFVITAGGISATSGNMKQLIKDSKDYPNWTQLRFQIPVTQDFGDIRIQCNILKPGTFWIDDLRLFKE